MRRHRDLFGPIGLDVSSHHVSAVQFSSDGDVFATARFERKTPLVAVSIDETLRIRDVLDRRGFVGNQLVIGIPDDMLLWASTTLPPRSSGAPIATLAHAELARSTSLTPDSFESQCWDLPEAGRADGRTQVICTGCAHESATSFLTPYDQAGFQTIAIEPRPCAAAAACRPVTRSDDGLVALIEIGEASSSPQLLIGGIPVYSRCTPEIGLDSLMLDIERHLGFGREAGSLLIDQLRDPLTLDMDIGPTLADIARLISSYLDALSTELQTAMDYAAYRYPEFDTDRIVLLGPGARLPGVREHVGQQIGHSPLVATPGAVTSCPAHLAEDTDDPGLIVALGLARVEEGQ